MFIIYHLKVFYGFNIYRLKLNKQSNECWSIHWIMMIKKLQAKIICTNTNDRSDDNQSKHARFACFRC